MENEKRVTKSKSKRRNFFITVAVVGIVALYFHFLRFNGFDDSAALYVGLPLILALAIGLSGESTSTVGAGCKALTIAILLSVPLFMEGIICVIMAAPILYSVVIVWGILADRAKEKKDKFSKLNVSAFTVLLTAMSFEGVQDSLSFERNNVVSYSQVIEEDIGEVRRRLSDTPDFSPDRPLFLRIFPIPAKVSGSGLNIGDQRKVEFIYKKWIFANAHIGYAIFEVTESEDNYLRFDIPHDDSYISHYLTWKKSEVFLESTEAGFTKVTWELSFERNLDPAWYFAPMQRYAASLAAKVLVANIADAT